MRLYWNNFGFPVNAAELHVQTTVVRNAAGRPFRRLVLADVKATLFGSTVRELSAAEDACKRALAQSGGRGLELRADDGFVVSSSLRGVGAIGLHVVGGPNFTDAMGPEYVSIRTVRFTVEGEYFITGTEAGLVSWEDSVSVVGNGGPSRRWRVPLRGRPVRQQTTQYSIVKATHQGQAVGHTRYPTPPPPCFGRKYLVNESEAVVRGFAEPRQNGYINYPIQWAYSFEADVPLVGLPSFPRM